MASELDVYLNIVTTSARRTFAALGTSPTILVAPVALALVSTVVGHFFDRLGPAAGYAQWALGAATFSGWMYFVRELVRGSRTSLAELPRSLVAYLGDVFGPMLLAAVFLVGGLFVAVMVPCFGCLLVPLVLLCNPAMEVLYCGKADSIGELFGAAMDFLRRNFWPWLAINALLLLVVGPVLLVGSLVFSLLLGLLTQEPMAFAVVNVGFGGPLVFVALVFRGYVFVALDAGTHRTRMFRASASTRP